MRQKAALAFWSGALILPLRRPPSPIPIESFGKTTGYSY
jgi:hypothetical protein